MPRFAPLTAAMAIIALSCLSGCQSCVEVGPHRYVCDPKTHAAADCPGGWHCGLEGYCHDPLQAKPWRCALETDGGDCSPGWHCGLTDARDQRECHAPTGPRDYACELDRDCEAGWRCGIDRVCVDPVIDQLKPHGSTLGPAQLVNPKLLGRAPRLLAVSPVQSIGSGFERADRQTIAAMDGDRLVVIDRDVSSSTPIGSNPARIQVLESVPGVVEIASLGSHAVESETHYAPFYYREGSFTYLVLSDGGAIEVQFPFDGGELPNDSDAGPFRFFSDENGDDVTVPANRLKVGALGIADVPPLLMFDSTPGLASPPLLMSFGAHSDAALFRFSSEFGAGENRIIDATSVSTFTPIEADHCLVFADNRGLWVIDAFTTGSGGWNNTLLVPLQVSGLDNEFCKPTSRDILSLNAGLDRYLAVSSRLKSPAGAAEELAVYDVSAWFREFSNQPGVIFGCSSPPNALCTQDEEDVPVSATLLYGPCAPCQTGRVASFSILPPVAGGLPTLDVRCRDEADGGVREHSVLVTKGGSSIGGACSVQTVASSSSLFRGPVTSTRPTPGAVAFGGSAGQLWQGTSTATVSPLTFDRAPLGLVRHGAALPVVFAEGVVGWPVPDLGILTVSSRDDDSRPIASVAGQLDLVVLRNGAVVSFTAPGPGGFRIVVPASTTAALASPNTAALASRRGRGTELLVGAADTLLASDLSDGRAEALATVLVPLPGSPILAIAPVPPLDGGASLIEAFVLTRGAALRVRAESEIAWSATRISLPVGRVPITVWAEGRAGRVGFDDGTVYSLDSVVALSTPAPDPHIYDYAVVCGQPYALGSAGLYRLKQAPGAVLATWSRVPPDPTSPLPIPNGPGRLFNFSEATGQASLFVFDDFGRSIVFPISSCDP